MSPDPTDLRAAALSDRAHASYAALDLIPSLSLPRPGLAEDNPNYAGLCAVCRRAQDQTAATENPGHV